MPYQGTTDICPSLQLWIRISRTSNMYHLPISVVLGGLGERSSPPWTCQRLSWSPGYNRCVMKADTMKAFDSVNMLFIINMFVAICVTSSFTEWVMPSYPRDKYSVSTSGTPCAYFYGQKDPVSMRWLSNFSLKWLILLLPQGCFLSIVDAPSHVLPITVLLPLWFCEEI